MKVVDSTITVNHNGHENMGKTYPAKLSGGYGFIAFHSLDVSDSTIIADENTKNGIYSYLESAVYDSCYLFVEEGIYGNSLRLAEYRIVQAERSGYKFLGWFAHRYEIAACIFQYIRYT